MKTLHCESLKPGDCFLVQWHDGDVQKYKVVENRPNHIVSNRWISTQGRWAPRVTVTKKSMLQLVTARPCEVDA